jgi:hypothetical protein
MGAVEDRRVVGRTPGLSTRTTRSTVIPYFAASAVSTLPSLWATTVICPPEVAFSPSVNERICRPGASSA